MSLSTGRNVPPPDAARGFGCNLLPVLTLLLGKPTARSDSPKYVYTIVENQDSTRPVADGWAPEFQYELCLKTFHNRLHLAPVRAPGLVLYAGCGLGANFPGPTDAGSRC